MHDKQRLALRAAGRIHERLIRVMSVPLQVGLPEQEWNEYRQLMHLIHKAETHGWQGAVRNLRIRLRNTFRTLQAYIDEGVRQLSPDQWRDGLLSHRQLYEEILALHNEFDEVRCDFQQETISVITERIVLEGIDLGSFEIRLDWNALDETHAYSVIAREPNPAASNAETTHPHVQSEHLCEGDGHRPIRAALAEGRLFDFFTIVDRTLATYNSGSPHVSLERWSGEPCVDCSYLLDDDERYSCQQCNDSCCGDCVVVCLNCEYYYCARCIAQCEACDDGFCESCIEECAACGGRFCMSCLCDNLFCGVCRDEREENSESEREESEEPTKTVLDRPHGGGIVADHDQTAVQSVRLGQAPVPS